MHSQNTFRRAGDAQPSMQRHAAPRGLSADENKKN